MSDKILQQAYAEAYANHRQAQGRWQELRHALVEAEAATDTAWRALQTAEKALLAASRGENPK